MHSTHHYHPLWQGLSLVSRKQWRGWGGRFPVRRWQCTNPEKCINFNLRVMCEMSPFITCILHHSIHSITNSTHSHKTCHLSASLQTNKQAKRQTDIRLSIFCVIHNIFYKKNMFFLLKSHHTHTPNPLSHTHSLTQIESIILLQLECFQWIFSTVLIFQSIIIKLQYLGVLFLK